MKIFVIAIDDFKDEKIYYTHTHTHTHTHKHTHTDTHTHTHTHNDSLFKEKK